MNRPSVLRCAKRAFALLAAAAALMVQAGASAGVWAAESAVILQYHRFGEDRYPSTSVTIAQLEAHIAHLKAGDYTVLPVPEILARIREGRPLPERAVGITIDDAARSVVDEAWPRFQEAGFPFTLFVSTDAVDQGHAGIASWDDIRRLARSGVVIGNHGASHERMWRKDDAANRADLLRANRRFEAELGAVPRLFAYPYGEWDLAAKALVAELGIDAAFGQQSGAVGRGADFLNLPRFPLNERYGDMRRFRQAVDTLPLDIRDLTPENPILEENPPVVRFTVRPPPDDLRGLACYPSNGAGVSLAFGAGGAVAVRLDGPYPPGRARLNCTLQAEGGRWRWFGIQFVAPG